MDNRWFDLLLTIWSSSRHLVVKADASRIAMRVGTVADEGRKRTLALNLAAIYPRKLSRDRSTSRGCDHQRANVNRPLDARCTC